MDPRLFNQLTHPLNDFRNHKKSKGPITLLILLSLLVHAIIFQLPIVRKNKKITDDDYIELVDLKSIDEGKIIDLIDPNIPDTVPKKPTRNLSDKNRAVDQESKAKFSLPTPNQNQSVAIVPLKQKKIPDVPKDRGSEFSKRRDQPTIQWNELFPQMSLPYDANDIDAKFSEQTRLNTKQFLYGTFFTRIKRQISSHWQPYPLFQIMVNRYGDRLPDRVRTDVVVVLNEVGELRSVFVKDSSGFAEWDNESVRSIRSAAPFLNPPDGILDEDRNIRFDFAFVGEFRSDIFTRWIQ